MTEEDLPALARKLGGSGAPGEHLPGVYVADCPGPHHAHPGEPNGALHLWWGNSDLLVACAAGCSRQEIETAVTEKFSPKKTRAVAKRKTMPEPVILPPRVDISQPPWRPIDHTSTPGSLSDRDELQQTWSQMVVNENTRLKRIWEAALAAENARLQAIEAQKIKDEKLAARKRK